LDRIFCMQLRWSSPTLGQESDSAFHGPYPRPHAVPVATREHPARVANMKSRSSRPYDFFFPFSPLVWVVPTLLTLCMAPFGNLGRRKRSALRTFAVAMPRSRFLHRPRRPRRRRLLRPVPGTDPPPASTQTPLEVQCPRGRRNPNRKRLHRDFDPPRRSYAGQQSTWSSGHRQSLPSLRI